MNKVIIIGRLGKDPEVVLNFVKLSVATSENFVNKEGRKDERTDWHNVLCFGKLREIVSAHLTKGSQVMVEGKISTDQYENSEGKTIYSTSIIAQQILFL